MAKEKKQDKPVEAEESKAEVIPSGPKWVKVTKEQLKKLQSDAKLIGYNPATEEAFIK
jgi:hypothetical protein